ncbi:MAG TPA: SLC13 family permease [Planctomycetes bacterium]|nr:SLC13 family permease [Planctomycetota bacterium]
MLPEFLHPWVAGGVTAGLFLVLQIRKRTPTDLLFLAGLVVLTLAGVVTPDQALAGFASPALIAVASLFVVSAALRSSGVLDWVGRRLLGTATTETQATARLIPSILITSAFLLNTAVVAMMLPVIVDWCRRRGISPSRLLLPLSYLTILGGVCTLIGTSTTIIVQGQLTEVRDNFESSRQAAGGGLSQKESGFAANLRELEFFELGYIGLPCALAGALFMMWIGPKLLPRRQDVAGQFDEHRREYLAEMLVQVDCSLIGQTIEEAGLRSLPGLFLIEIDREGEIITPVTPHHRLHAGDRLVFTGIVATIVDLERIPGLVPAADHEYEPQPQRHMTEVVLSRASPLIGLNVRDANFRQRYNAAVLAVHRRGDRVTRKIGDIVLEPGDTLLLQTRGEFITTHRNNREFYLVSDVAEATPMRAEKMPVAALIGLGLVIWLTATSFVPRDTLSGFASPAIAALTAAILMALTRCVRLSDARASLDIQILLTIAAALGIGKALDVSGVARMSAESLVAIGGEVFGDGSHPFFLLFALYLLTVIFTETITNNAVAAIMIPLAASLAWAGDVSPRPFIIAVALGSSLSFVTPIGYQTNLMVMGPGGYRPSDYLRTGLPLAITVGVIAMLLIPKIWPF